MAGDTRHWPVRAWIRLRLPPSEAPMVLMGTPPPPEPPGDFLVPLPSGPDPRKRLFGWEEPDGDGVLRMLWDSDEPERLNVELRLPGYGERLSPERLRAFYDHARQRLSGLGRLSIESADPRP